MKIGIYHSKDFDGIASAMVLKYYYKNIKLIGYDYGGIFPYNEISVNDDIIMCDISLKMKDMHYLSERCNSFIWIDHHISAINDYIEYKKKYKSLNITTHLFTDKAACVLTWEYFFKNIKAPKSIEILGKYDIWDQSDINLWIDEILPFQYGMRMNYPLIEDFPTKLLKDDSLCDPIINNGLTVLKYQNSVNLKSATASFEANIGEYKAICLNSYNLSSTAFDYCYDITKHDLMVAFSFSGKTWKFTIYTTKENVDCSVIAKKYGGGGHKKAAGFELPADSNFILK